jgi:hypothetical protein
VRVAEAPVRPAGIELVGWLSLGAVVGLVVLVFQPPLSIALAVGLPATAAGWAWLARHEVVPRSAYVLGAFGLGVLMVDAVLLVPLAL